MAHSSDDAWKRAQALTPRPNEARYWKEEPDGRHAWIVICARCNRQVVLLSDSKDVKPETKKCSLCVREMDVKRWEKAGKPR